MLQGVVAVGLSSAAALISAGCTSPPTPRVPRIGLLSLATNPAIFEPFRKGLQELGYVLGESIVIVERYTLGNPDLASALAAELVALNLDVIVTAGNQNALPVKMATKTIPIVAVILDDPVAIGLVASLARPGGNVTGFTHSYAGTELGAKRLELLKQAVPTAVRVAVLGVSNSFGSGTLWSEIQGGAPVLGIQLVRVVTSGGADLERAFDAALTAHADALIGAPNGILFSNSAKIAELALRKRLPALFPEREYADAGGLLAYGPSFSDMWRRAAGYVDRILRGARPADLPIEQPARIDFVINLRTAAALGLTIPPSVLAQATEVLR